MKTILRSNLIGLTALLFASGTASAAVCSQIPAVTSAAISQSAVANSRSQTRLKAVAPGSFGGEGINVTVGKHGVTIEYDCGNGEISKQLKIDKRGNFKIDGTHKRGTFGPTRLDNLPKDVPARYEGTITGKVMKFKVTLIETNQVIGEYTATRGKVSKLRRCA